MKNDIKYIAFDADDTLWVNENYFREAEEAFYQLLSNYQDKETLAQILFDKEIGNLPLYGYGIKGFSLSMVETALEISNHEISPKILHQILDLGKAMFHKPIILLDHVKEVLEYLTSKKYTLIVATKGDLLDQQRKLQRSKIEHYFHHIEILSDKKIIDYQLMLRILDIEANEFAMIGNSFKSDVIPIVDIGGVGIHIPFHTTWAHEEVDQKTKEESPFIQIKKLDEIVSIF